MKRILVVLVIVIATACVTFAYMGGLSFRREVKYRDPDLKLGEPISVNLQNVRQSGWGGSLLESSTYGPPFDLFVFGTLPQDTPVTSVLLSGLNIRASDGTELLSVPAVSLRLSEGQTLKGGVLTSNKSFSYEAKAFTASTFPSLTVSFDLVMGGAVPQHVRVTKRFNLERFRRLSLGSNDLALLTRPSEENADA